MGEVYDYINQKGWKFKTTPKGTEYTLKTCPLCGDTRFHFYINMTDGRWHCKKCHEGGSLYGLKKHLGDIAPIQKFGGSPLPTSKFTKMAYDLHLSLSEATKKYLKEVRLLDDKTIDMFEFGTLKEKGKEWVSMPNFDLKGECRSVKYRILPPEKVFRYETGSYKSLYGKYLVKDKKEVLIFESELDACLSNQLGFPAVALGGADLKEEDVDFLKSKKRVFLVLDSDIEGQRAAKKIAKRIGMSKCWNIILPEKDLCDYLRAVSPEEWRGRIEGFIKEATLFRIENIVSIYEATQELLNERFLDVSRSAIYLPWKKLDFKTMPIEVGDLVLVSAFPGIGKTTFTLNIADYNAENEIPVFFYCLEMRTTRLVQKVMDRKFKAKAKINQMEELLPFLEDYPFYFGSNYRGLTAHKVFDTMKECKDRYGVQLIVFDNFNFLIRKPDNYTSEMDVLSKEFKTMAEDLEVVMFLIAQPRKLSSPGSRMTMQDIRGSSVIPADADQIWLLHRDRIDDGDSGDAVYSNEMVVTIEKARYSGGGVVKFKFNGELSLFEEIS